MPSTLPTFSVREIPFSMRGSWLDLSPVVGLHTTSEHVHLVSHVTGMHAVLRLAPASDPERGTTEVSATPAALRWQAGGTELAAASFESPSIVRLRGSAEFTLSDPQDRLTPFSGSYFFFDPVDGGWTFTSYETGRRYRATVLSGLVSVEGAEALGEHVRSIALSADADRPWEIALEEIETAAPAYAASDDFASVAARAAREFTAYLDAIAPWRTDDTPAVALATYVLWSATVAPAGFLGRESILMSKHWMDKVWSWDHAFNALAVAGGLPDLAIDQFLAPFDHQDPTGALPDSITHSEVLYNFVKPPIHGWAFTRLRERLSRDLTRDELAEFYVRLTRWSRFWLDHRVAPGRQLPLYQHGNDSGWDNSTAFDDDRVVEAPDLAAFLAVQLHVVADLADELQRAEEASQWRAEAGRLLEALLAQLHDDDGFFAASPLTGRPSKRTSLLTRLPVLAADHLPDTVVSELAAGIADHLTPWGPATQLLATPEYEDDGYWRGPIWAPSTMLIEEGLRRGGHRELADTVNASFRALCETSGFAENFDAVSGEGLRDRAYTWTASVYLVFSHDATRRAGESEAV